MRKERLLKGLKKLAGGANNDRLKEVFKIYDKQTEGQTERFKSVFLRLDMLLVAKMNDLVSLINFSYYPKENLMKIFDA